MPIEIGALQGAGEALHEVAHAIHGASPDPTPEAMVVVAHVMSAHEVLTQLVRYLQLGATPADAVTTLLKDLAQDRERLALPDMNHSIRGEIGAGLLAARLMSQAGSVGELAQYRRVIVAALESAQAKLNGSTTGSRLN